MLALGDHPVFAQNFVEFRLAIYDAGPTDVWNAEKMSIELLCVYIAIWAMIFTFAKDWREVFEFMHELSQKIFLCSTNLARMP
jgi:hypothetical protein